jgi:hypothetical protein
MIQCQAKELTELRVSLLLIIPCRAGQEDKPKRPFASSIFGFMRLNKLMYRTGRINHGESSGRLSFWGVDAEILNVTQDGCPFNIFL